MSPAPSSLTGEVEGAATAALASPVQAGFDSTFSGTGPLPICAPVNDLVHLGHCWAQAQIQSCPQLHHLRQLKCIFVSLK